MRTTILLISFAISVLTDRYIYRRVIRPGFGRLGRSLYIVYAALTNAAALVIIALGYLIPEDGNGLVRKGIMWATGLFLLNVAPKFLYAVVSLGDYPLRRYKGGRSHLFGYAGTVLGLCLAGVMVYGMSWGRSEIRVERVELTFDKLPRSFDGLRVVQFSDNHLGTLMRRDRFLRRMVDTVNSLRPDIVVNSGDIVNNHERELDTAAISILGGISARYGVYSVLGNHDTGMYIDDTVRYPIEEHMEGLLRKERQMGWTVLRDSSAYLSNGEDSIVLSGLNYPAGFTRMRGHSMKMTGADIGAAYGDIPESYFDLTISHAPQLWNDLLAAGRGDLTLSGHVHAMQFKTSLGGWSWSPACLLYDRWSGLYEEEGRYLYINDGTGYVMLPMRIGSKPEVTLIVLRSGIKRENQ